MMKTTHFFSKSLVFYRANRLGFFRAKEQLLTIAFLKRGTRANRSLSLFNKSDFEQKSKERQSEFPTLILKLV